MDFEKDPQTEPQETGFILMPDSVQDGGRADSQPGTQQAAQEPDAGRTAAGEIPRSSQPETMPHGKPQQENASQPDNNRQESAAQGQSQQDPAPGQEGQGRAGTPKKVRKTGLAVLLGLCGLSVAFGLIGLISEFKAPGNGGRHGEFPVFSGRPSGREHIAVLHIEGTIQDKNDTYDQEWLLTTIRDLSHNRSVKAILLDINSPGGGVYQSDEVYLELLDYKETSGNPVWAFFGPLAASGGYYIACAADYIVANRNTLTGSIGVIAGQSVDFSQLLERHGIKVSTFTAGRNKDMLGISTPVTPEHREIMQSLADECYHQFVEVVAESRGLTMEEALDLADGRVYTAWQALDKGLVDVVGRFDDALSYLQEELDDLSLDPVHYYPEEESTFMEYVFKNMRSLVSGIIPAASSPESLLMEAKERVAPDLPYPAYYYQP